MRTWSQLGAQNEKCDNPRRAVRTPLCRAFGPKLPRRTGFNHAGGETPAHCDAKRVGEAARGSLKRRYPPKIFPKFFQNAPEVLPRTSQEPPKPFPNQARSTHETKEAPKKRPRAPKKRQHGAQERPNGAQEPPQTLQNEGIECSRPNFLMFFSMLFFRW